MAPRTPTKRNEAANTNAPTKAQAHMQRPADKVVVQCPATLRSPALSSRHANHLRVLEVRKLPSTAYTELAGLLAGVRTGDGTNHAAGSNTRPAAGLPLLEVLSLAGSHCGDAAVLVLLPALHSLLALHTLDVSACCLTDAAGLPLASLISHQAAAAAQDAWARGLRRSGATARASSDAPGVQQAAGRRGLRVLLAADNQLTGRSLEALAAAAADAFAALQEVDLSCNPGLPSPTAAARTLLAALAADPPPRSLRVQLRQHWRQPQAGERREEHGSSPAAAAQLPSAGKHGRVLARRATSPATGKALPESGGGRGARGRSASGSSSGCGGGGGAQGCSSSSAGARAPAMLAPTVLQLLLQQGTFAWEGVLPGAQPAAVDAGGGACAVTGACGQQQGTPQRKPTLPCPARAQAPPPATAAAAAAATAAVPAPQAAAATAMDTAAPTAAAAAAKACLAALHSRQPSQDGGEREPQAAACGAEMVQQQQQQEQLSSPPPLQDQKQQLQLLQQLLQQVQQVQQAAMHQPAASCKQQGQQNTEQHQHQQQQQRRRRQKHSTQEQTLESTAAAAAAGDRGGGLPTELLQLAQTLCVLTDLVEQLEQAVYSSAS